MKSGLTMIPRSVELFFVLIPFESTLRWHLIAAVRVNSATKEIAGVNPVLMVTQILDEIGETDADAFNMSMGDEDSLLNDDSVSFLCDGARLPCYTRPFVLAKLDLLVNHLANMNQAKVAILQLQTRTLLSVPSGGCSPQEHAD